VVCRPKDQGGLGVHELEVKNLALLGKWLFKLLTEDGVWQTLLKRKYIGSKALSQVLGTRIFGLASWLRRNSSFLMALSLLMTDHRNGFGRIFG
jgi:hypothetical protein